MTSRGHGRSHQAASSLAGPSQTFSKLEQDPDNQDRFQSTRDLGDPSSSSHPDPSHPTSTPFTPPQVVPPPSVPDATTLQAQIFTLMAQVTTLQNQIASMPPPTPGPLGPARPAGPGGVGPASATPTTPIIKVAKPKEFDGTVMKLEQFIHTCELYLTTQAFTDDAKVLFALLYMKKGNAEPWAWMKAATLMTAGWL
jgi:hypothetical protein